MQQAGSNVKIVAKKILSCLPTNLIVIVCFILLGTFYDANEHSILWNIIIWCLTIFIGHLFCVLIKFAINKIFKKSLSVKLLDLWSFCSSLLIVSIICLIFSKNVDDYLFIEVMGIVSAILGIFSLAYECKKPTI